jgi:hypothetical protein
MNRYTLKSIFVIMSFMLIINGKSYACDQYPLADIDVYPVDSDGPFYRWIHDSSTPIICLGGDSNDPDNGPNPGDGIIRYEWWLYSYTEDKDECIYYNYPPNSSFSFYPAYYINYNFINIENYTPGLYEIGLYVIDDENWASIYPYYYDYRNVYLVDCNAYCDEYNNEIYIPYGSGTDLKYEISPDTGWSYEDAWVYLMDEDDYICVAYNVSNFSDTISWDGISNYEGPSYYGQYLPAGVYYLCIYVECPDGTIIDNYLVTEQTITVVKVEMINPTGDPTNSSEAQENVNEFTFNSSSTGHCYIKCEAQLTPDNAQTQEWAESNVVWYIDPGLATSTIKWGYYSVDEEVFVEGDNKGMIVWIEYSGLPKSNSEFVLHTIYMAITGAGIPESDIEVFYNKNATNHPSDASNSNWPNWMYYWLQTVTPLGDPYPSFHYGVSTYFDPGTTDIYLSSLDAIEYDAPYGTNNTLKGIDNFAWTVRHESQHYQDWIDFWSNNITNWNSHLGGTGPSDDKDGDRIPNQTEDVNLNGTYDSGDLYDFNDLNTPTPGRPSIIHDDFQDWDCQRNKNIKGDHSLDWGSPGMKHYQNDVYDN